MWDGAFKSLSIQSHEKPLKGPEHRPGHRGTQGCPPCHGLHEWHHGVVQCTASMALQGDLEQGWTGCSSRGQREGGSG